MNSYTLCTIPAKRFAEMLKQISYCAERNPNLQSGRISLSCIHIVIEGECMRMTCTDGFRYAAAWEPVEAGDTPSFAVHATHDANLVTSAKSADHVVLSRIGEQLEVEIVTKDSSVFYKLPIIKEAHDISGLQPEKPMVFTDVTADRLLMHAKAWPKEKDIVIKAESDIVLAEEADTGPSDLRDIVVINECEINDMPPMKMQRKFLVDAAARVPKKSRIGFSERMLVITDDEQMPRVLHAMLKLKK